MNLINIFSWYVTSIFMVSQLPNLMSVFQKFFFRLLNYSPVFLKDLFWDNLSVCLLMVYVMQLTALGIYFLVMVSESTVPLNLLKNAIYYSLT
jgi:hypothetical protein